MENLKELILLVVGVWFICYMGFGAGKEKAMKELDLEIGDGKEKLLRFLERHPDLNVKDSIKYGGICTKSPPAATFKVYEVFPDRNCILRREGVRLC